MDNRPIGVFDSGLGGLTAMRELIRTLPNESILYFGDTGRVPYGSRGREIIRKYAKQDMNFLIRHDVKAVLAACGTVSSVARDIGDALPVPYFDVLRPTARAAVEQTKNGKIGIIGTAATIASGSYRKEIERLAPNPDVYENVLHDVLRPVSLQEETGVSHQRRVITAAHLVESLAASVADRRREPGVVCRNGFHVYKDT